MIELNRSLIDTYLDEAVAEFGEDYVYSKGDTGTCNYVRNGAPPCLVGPSPFPYVVSFFSRLRASRPRRAACPRPARSS